MYNCHICDKIQVLYFSGGGVKLSKVMVTKQDSTGIFGEEVKLPHSAIQAQFGFLQGKVLTVVEASIEGQKLEAVKSLIKKMFAEQQTWVRELCFPETRMMTSCEAQAKIQDYDELVLEEV